MAKDFPTQVPGLYWVMTPYDSTYHATTVMDDQIFTGPGIFGGFWVNIAGAGGSTIVIMDSTDGVDGEIKISTLGNSSNAGAGYGLIPMMFTLGCRVTTTSGGAFPSITIFWKQF